MYSDGRKAIHGALAQAPAKIADATGGVALTAGEQVSVSKSKPVAKQKVNVDYELAWADGWLTYEDKTIAEVASEFNRRNRVKIVVEDAAIAGRRLAFFRGSATDPESFVAALEANADITVVRDDPEVLRVEPTPMAENAPTGVEHAPPPVNEGTRI